MNLARGEASRLIADPVFRGGYEDAWAGLDKVPPIFEDEWRAYGAGYDFALWLQNQGQRRMGLTHGGFPRPEAVAEIIRCFKFSAEVIA